MKKLTLTETSFKVRGEIEPIKSDMIKLLFACLDQPPELGPNQHGFKNAERRLRDEIEKTITDAQKANKGKLPLDVIFDDAMAEHLKRIVVTDMIWGRRGSDIKDLAAAVENMEDVTVVKDKIVPIKKNEK